MFQGIYTYCNHMGLDEPTDDFRVLLTSCATMLCAKRKVTFLLSSLTSYWSVFLLYSIYFMLAIINNVKALDDPANSASVTGTPPLLVTLFCEISTLSLSFCRWFFVWRFATFRWKVGTTTRSTWMQRRAISLKVSVEECSEGLFWTTKAFRRECRVGKQTSMRNQSDRLVVCYLEIEYEFFFGIYIATLANSITVAQTRLCELLLCARWIPSLMLQSNNDQSAKLVELIV